MNQFERDRQNACRWAHRLLQKPDSFVVLDTETTGLYDAEPVQIAVIRSDGSTLLDTLVKPTIPVSEGAARVHGITEERLKDAPRFSEVYPKLRAVVADLIIVTYNVAFDQNVINQACHAASLERLSNVWECAMEAYAEFCGEWSDRHQSYTWQKLPGGDHSAIGDCRAALRIMQKMAAEYRAEWDMNPEQEAVNQ